MSTNKVVVKKYENRRLYDTTNSRYVNLEDVAAMVRQGIDVEVLDAKTGEDLTRLILTQIVVEDAKERESALPLDVLRQLVLASGRASQEALAQYIRSVSDLYQKAYQALVPTNPVELMRAMFGSPAASSRYFGFPPAPAPAATAPEPGPSPKDESERLAALLQRIEELERRLEERSKPARPAKRARRR
jgi:polyhydroxyalkanoate synthesis repressor PhaR